MSDAQNTIWIYRELGGTACIKFIKGSIQRALDNAV